MTDAKVIAYMATNPHLDKDSARPKSHTRSTPSRPLSPAVRKHMAVIGAEGGRKRANHPDRKILAREAARISWMPEARAKRLKKKVENNLK